MSRPRNNNVEMGLSRYRRRKDFAKRRIDKAISQAYRRLSKNKDCYTAFQQLLLAVQSATDLVRPTPEHCRWSDACLYVQGLMNLATHCRDFVRPLHRWSPSEDSRRKVFASLAQHMLMKYQTPTFMMSAWLRPASALARQQQTWHIGMTRGMSIRRMDVPFRMTRRMESFFLAAPDHFTIEEAMRYSQVLGLGGDKDLADAVIATRLGGDLSHEDFWETVIRFFVSTNGMTTEHVNPIVDFLHYIKFAKREVATEKGIVVLGPPCPEFSMKSRSLRSVMRMVRRWHGDLAKCKNNARLSWRRSSIRDFVYLEETRDSDSNRLQRIWSISQLLSGAQLLDEGRTMGHCAGIYSLACYKGRTTIWSMKQELNQATRRVLTIEVDPKTRCIRQARAKYNRMPNKHALEILKKWAARDGLTVGIHL